MKKTMITAGLTLASTMAAAGPYIGLGYQGSQARIEQGELTTANVDGRSLDLSDKGSNSDFSALLGYQFGETWSLELGWQQAEVDASFEIRSPAQDEEWDASVEGTHITLAPVYRRALGEKLGLRATAGLVYGRYDIRQSHEIDVENGPDQVLSNFSRNESEFGGTLGVGLEYTTPWKIDVIGEVRHQRTKVLSTSGAAINLVYRF